MYQKNVMEPEVASQFSYSLVGLLHLYHDYVFWKKEKTDKVELLTNCQKCVVLHVMFGCNSRS